MKATLFVIVDTLIDIVFLVDIVLMFLTSTINERGKPLFDSRHIAAQYTKTFRFYLDFLSLFGAGVFESIHPYFKLFGFFKMFRVFRISKMIQECTANETTKALLNLAKLMLYLVFYLHGLGCYWWITISFNAPV